MQQTEFLNSTQPKLRTQSLLEKSPVVALEPPKMKTVMDMDMLEAGPENVDTDSEANNTENTPVTGTSHKTRGGADSRVRKPSKYLSYPYTSFPAETEGTPMESLLSTKLDTKSEMKRKNSKTEIAASLGKELEQKRKMGKMSSLHQLQNEVEEITGNETGNKCSLVSEISQNHSSLASKKKQKLDAAQLHQGAQFVWHLDAKGTECSPLVVDLQNKGIGENKEEQVSKISNPPPAVAPSFENFMTPPLDTHNKIIGENKEEQVPKVSNPPAAAAPPMEYFMTSPLDLQNKSIDENKEEHVPKVSSHPAAVAPPLEHLTPTQSTRPMSMSVETSPTLQLFDHILHKMSLVLEKLRK